MGALVFVRRRDGWRGGVTTTHRAIPPTLDEAQEMELRGNCTTAGHLLLAATFWNCCGDVRWQGKRGRRGRASDQRERECGNPVPASARPRRGGDTHAWRFSLRPTSVARRFRGWSLCL